jgi:hypothetical protein
MGSKEILSSREAACPKKIVVKQNHTIWTAPELYAELEL